MNDALKNSFGKKLRNLRRLHGLTLEQAAASAGIGRVTLNRWETGAQRPRVAEWLALMKSLEASPQQTRQLESLLDTAWAQNLVRQELIETGERTEMGSVPHGGDLLRAMRIRQKFRLAEAAEQIGVSEWTLRRWEKGTVWPSMTQLHALCFALNAEEEEIVALTCGDMGLCGEPALRNDIVSADSIEHRLKEIERQIGRGAHRLIELQLLDLKRHAWSLAVKRASGRHLLSYAYIVHTRYFDYRGNIAEVAQQSARGLEILPENGYQDEHAMELAFFRAFGMVNRNNGISPQRGIEMLRPWLSVKKWPVLRAQIYSVMAIMAAQAQNVAAALPFSDAAMRLVADRSPVERAERAFMHAYVLMREPERASQALDVIPEVHEDQLLLRYETTLLRAEILTVLGDYSEARLWLDKTLSASKTYRLHEANPRVDALMQKL